MMNKKDAEIIIKDLSEKPFACSKHCIETESGYVITTKEKQKYARSKKQTNADRIRNMTDEELYKFLRFFGVCRICKHRKDEGCDNRGCTQEEVDVFFKEWLQAEVKEGAVDG